MKRVRKSEERGKADHGWLKSYHSFSFADYYDPEHMGFGPLRVINEDRVAPGQGFGTHPHHNMEIFSYVISGELAHKDSMGNVKTIKAGELQMMSAGRGVAHSEFNPSTTDTAHFLQVWLLPHTKNLTPSYAEWKPSDKALATLTLLLSPDGRNGSLKIQQDASIFLGKLKKGEEHNYSLTAHRSAWLQVMEGEIRVGDAKLSIGDGLAITDEAAFDMQALSDSSFLLFDLAQASVA